MGGSHPTCKSAQAPIIPFTLDNALGDVKIL